MLACWKCNISVWTLLVCMLAVSSKHLCANKQPHRVISMSVDGCHSLSTTQKIKYFGGFYVSGRFRHHQRCLHRFRHQLCGLDFPNRSTKGCDVKSTSFDIQSTQVNVFHTMVSLLLHVSSPEHDGSKLLHQKPWMFALSRVCGWTSCCLLSFAHSSSSYCSLLFCFCPSVSIQTLFPVSSCHCEEEFVPSRVARFSLSELTLTCGCERPRSTSRGPWGYVCLESDWWEDWATLMLLLLLLLLLVVVVVVVLVVVI